MNAIRKHVPFEHLQSIKQEVAELVALHRVIEVTRPDGQTGYAWAPALPCTNCGGSGFSPDADFGDMSGLCPECHGTGIEE